MSNLIILTGKTASGKDTIKDLLLQRHPGIKRVITTTSRSARPYEENGVDYLFLSKNEFKNKIKKGEFIEYVDYGGNLYGTQRNELVKGLNNHDLLWKIDPSRAAEIRQFIKRSFSQDLADEIIKKILVIYITTSDEVVLERLKQRSLSNVEIKKRMQDDQKIWEENKNSYDFVLENVPDKLYETVDKITKIINQQKT